MNKKVLIIPCLILIFISLSLVSGENTNNLTKPVSGIDFQIPPQYDGGILKNNSYIYINPYNFRILSLDNYNNLRFNFGSDMLEGSVITTQETTIGNHPAYVIYSYIDIANSNLTSIYLSIEDTIFVISYKGDSITPEIENMIENTPPSTITSEQLYSKLSEALSDYRTSLNQEEIEYQQQEYEQSNRGSDFFFFYVR